MNFEHLVTDTFHQAVRCRDTGVLLNKWLPATSNLGYDTFRAAVLQMASIAKEQKATKVLVDGTDFHMGMPPNDFWTWRGEHISPLYNETVAKFAFVWSDGSPLPPNNGEVSAPDTFPTTHFTSTKAAMEWLVA